MLDLPSGWPDDFGPKEWDCIDRGGYFGKRGSVYRVLPTSRSEVHENARRCAWSLQALRDELGGRPIIVRSGWRPVAYNRCVGSKDSSQHVLGTAADISCKGVTTSRLHSRILELIAAGRMDQGGVGLYTRSRFVHYDVRGNAARWRGN